MNAIDPMGDVDRINEELAAIRERRPGPNGSAERSNLVALPRWTQWTDGTIGEWPAEPATLENESRDSFGLPAIDDGAELISGAIAVPSDVVEGIVHRGGKMVLGGASKSFKTWSLLDLAISVATGRSWLGRFPTKRGRVLYINLEIQSGFFAKRIQTICDEAQIKLDSGYLRVWNLRGYAADLSRLRPRLLAGIGCEQFDLIILDPVYKLLGIRDENKAGDIASLLNEIESLCVQTEAAIAFGAHYSKGNQAQKDSIDRIGGSGVFARDPDTILNFTKHEEQDCFTVEMTLRNHPPRDPFVVRWDYPLFVVDSLLNPNRLKQTGGRPRVATEAQILELLDEKPLKAVEWQKSAREEFGIAASTFYEMKRTLEDRGRIQSIAGHFNKI
jgi:AAA domain